MPEINEYPVSRANLGWITIGAIVLTGFSAACTSVDRERIVYPEASKDARGVVDVDEFGRKQQNHNRACR